jgi:son of sevenless-like protein
MIQTLQASHHHHASPSSSASFAINPAPPTPTSPLRIPTHVQAIHHFDPSLLASTSTASFNPNMYLNFRAGEIIRVHVRDGTGWWDGEISTAVEKEARVGPRRGWFPSNYVREMGWDGVSLCKAT